METTSASPVAPAVSLPRDLDLAIINELLATIRGLRAEVAGLEARIAKLEPRARFAAVRLSGQTTADGRYPDLDAALDAFGRAAGIESPIVVESMEEDTTLFVYADPDAADADSGTDGDEALAVITLSGIIASRRARERALDAQGAEWLRAERTR